VRAWSGSGASHEVKAAGDDDRPLIDRVRRGDQDAARTLYERYFDRIYNYVYARLGGVDAAEDLAIGVMTRCLTRLDQFRDQGVAFSSWVYRVAHDATNDQYQRRVNAANTDRTAPTQPADPAELALENLPSEDLRAALRELSDEQQQVLILRFFQDLTAGQVGEIMGKTVGAIQALQHEALGSLEQGLQARARN
jgi:RNA polymerase sigma-70 factor (ECF subfamily)